MTERLQSLRFRVMLSLLRGRFESLDAILLSSLFIHGVWFLGRAFGWWVPTLFFTSVVYETVIVIMGALMIVTAALGIYSLVTRNRDLRAHADFAQFLLWSFLSIMMITVAEVRLPFWVGYITLSLMAGVLRLNSSAGLGND